MMNHPVRSHTTVALASLALTLLPGCGWIASSSKLVSSPFVSSSKSSSPETAYREDVSDYTAAHLQSAGTPDELRRQIGALAGEHGITDWEHNESTFEAIGQGLAKAGYKQVQVDAFKNNLGKTPEQAKWIQDGYDETR